MSELDEIRQKKIRELQMLQQRAQQQHVEDQFKAQEIDQQIKLIMRQIMTPKARERLANIRLARPEFARQVEVLLIQLYQSGRLKALDDDQFRALLSKISGGKRETKIKVK